jgi:type VI secretion system secreted protein Hcp
MAIYAKITGKKQGVLTGGVTAQAFTGQIEVHSVDFGVGSPSDVSTGLATGKRVARPMVITKPLDRSSPLLHRACVTNESVTVLLSYTIEGQGHATYVTIALTNGMVQDYNQQAAADGTATERLTFTYSKIEFTWTTGGIVSTHDWMGST